MSLLLATIAAGEAIDYGHITVPRMYEYARKVGADFHALSTNCLTLMSGFPGLLSTNPSWWKLALLEWFASQETYVNLAYVDIDVFIPKHADDIFRSALRQENNPKWHGIHMCQDMNDDRELPLWKNWAAENYPKVEILQKPDHYLNAGVWVIDRVAAMALTKFLHENELIGRWVEQDILLLAAYHSELSRILPSKFNQPIPFKHKDVSDKTGFWHLCGMPQNSKLEWLQRMDKADRNGWTTI